MPEITIRHREPRSSFGYPTCAMNYWIRHREQSAAIHGGGPPKKSWIALACSLAMTAWWFMASMQFRSLETGSSMTRLGRSLRS